MKTAAIHALEHDEMPAPVGDRNRDGDAGGAGLVDRDGGHFSRALMGQALAVGDIHDLSPCVVRVRNLFRHDCGKCADFLPDFAG